MVRNGEDGTDIEFIYKLTTEYEAPELPESIQDDEYEESEDYDPEQEYIPEGWTDNPLGISEEASIWMICVRYKKKGIFELLIKDLLYGQDGELKVWMGMGYRVYIYSHNGRTSPTLPANSKEDIRMACIRMDR